MPGRIKQMTNSDETENLFPISLTKAIYDDNGNRLDNILSGYAPIGAVQIFAGNNTPYGYLFCDGSAVSRAKYKDLFDVIGTIYGEGDGSTTFNLPNLIDRFVQGNTNVGEVKEAGLPNIEGRWTTSWNSNVRGFHGLSTSGAFYRDSDTSRPGRITSEDTSAGNSPTNGYPSLDASLSNPIYGASDTVQPPAVTMRYIIKYI